MKSGWDSDCNFPWIVFKLQRKRKNVSTQSIPSAIFTHRFNSKLTIGSLPPITGAPMQVSIRTRETRTNHSIYISKGDTATEFDTLCRFYHLTPETLQLISL